MTVHDRAGVYRPAIRAPVVIDVEGTRVFGGVVQHITETDFGDYLGNHFTVEAADWTVLLETTLFNGVATGPTLKDLVTFFVTGSLGARGFSVHPDQAPGPVLGDRGYDFAYVSAIFDEWAAATGWPWTIDPLQRILFAPPAGRPAPIALRADNDTIHAIATVTDISGYVNAVWLHYGPPGLRDVTESWTGDGTRRAFPARAFPQPEGITAGPPTALVNGVTETVGPVDDPTASWWWRPADATLLNAPTRATLAAGVTLSWIEVAQFPGAVYAANTAEIALYGEFSVRVTNPNILDVTQAQDAAAGELLARGGLTHRVNLATPTPGLFPGHVVTVDVAERALVNQPCLIVTERLAFAGKKGEDASDVWRFDLELVVGAIYGESWQKFFRDLAPSGAGSGTSSGAVGPPAGGGDGGGGTTTIAGGPVYAGGSRAITVTGSTAWTPISEFVDVLLPASHRRDGRLHVPVSRLADGGERDDRGAGRRARERRPRLRDQCGDGGDRLECAGGVPRVRPQLAAGGAVLPGRGADHDRGQRGLCGGRDAVSEGGGLMRVIRTERAAFTALPARAAEPVLSVTASGDVRQGALVAGDIPAAFTRDDAAETITEPWTWDGDPILWTVTGVAPPSAVARSVGTRLVLFPNPGAIEYAVGIESGAVWASVPITTEHKWYQGTSARLRLMADGTLAIEQGSGTLQLASTGGHGAIQVPGGSLNVETPTADIRVTTMPNGALYPSANYRTHLGALQAKWLSIHGAELWVETLVAQQTMATIGGRIFVAATSSLTRDCAPGDTLIYTKHNNFTSHLPPNQYGAWLLLESGGRFEIMQVSVQTYADPQPPTAQGDYPYYVLRAQLGTAEQWYAGDALVSTGGWQAATGRIGGGFLDVYSLSGVTGSGTGPTIVGNIRTGATPAAWQPRWAIGNLHGLYGNPPERFGAVFGAPTAGLHLQVDDTAGIQFLDATNLPYATWDMAGLITLGRAALPNVQIDGTGMRLRHGATAMMTLEAASGDLTLTGNLRSGPTTTYTSAGTGFFLGWNGGTPQFRIGGQPGTNAKRITWDGFGLHVVAAGLRIDDATGIVLEASSVHDPPRSIEWTAGGRIWQHTDGILHLESYPGSMELIAQTGRVYLSAGAPTTHDQTFIQLNPFGADIEIGGRFAAGGNKKVDLVPAADLNASLGHGGRRWDTVWMNHSSGGLESAYGYPIVIQPSGVLTSLHIGKHGYWDPPGGGRLVVYYGIVVDFVGGTFVPF